MAIVKAGFDTDEDGWGEFLCAWTDKGDLNYILMYEATADNTYDLVWYWNYPIPANSFAGIAVGDIDHNGKVDIITTMPAVTDEASPNPPRLWVFEWSGVQGENHYGRYSTGESQPTNQWNFNLPDQTDFRPYSLTIEDIDNDDRNELVIGQRQGDSPRGREVMVASVQGELSGFGQWTVEYSAQNLDGGSLYSVTTGDLDGDGNREIYAFVWNNFTFRIFECFGDGNYELAFTVDQLYADREIDFGALDAVRVADVNNDGINEMYIAGTEPVNQLFVVSNISDLSAMTADDIKEFYSIPVQAEGKLRSMQVADPDQDGKMDLMIAGEMNGQIFDLEYKGEGDPADPANWELFVAFDLFQYAGFPPEAGPTFDPRLFYGSPATDMDQDGLNEYAFVNYRSNFDQWADDSYVFLIEADKDVTGIESSTNKIPSDFTLYQNYPNPFNPLTNINFSVPEESYINLSVYDALGNKIETLIDNKMAPGNHSVIFNAKDLSSGTYFYRLETDKFSETKKLTVIK